MSGVSDYMTANAEMFALPRAALNLLAPGIIGYKPEIRYQGVTPTPDVPPPAQKYWARCSRQTVREGQESIGTPFENSKSMYGNDGLVFVELYGPLLDGQAWEKLQMLAVVCRDSFRGKQTASGMWFLNARINELPDENNWKRINVVSEYTYSEIG